MTSNTETKVNHVSDKIRCYALGAEKPSRYAHSIRVAETAVILCKLYNVDSELGYLAGIAHDICKEMDNDNLLSLAQTDGLEITPLEESKPSLLHGRGAAVLLEKQFDITEKSVLEAVRYHTFGAPGMSKLAQILYIADKIEPGRNYIVQEKMDYYYSLSLTNLLITVVSENISWLENQGKKVAPISRSLLQELKKTFDKENDV